MPNPSGANQLGDTNVPYGDVKRTYELTRAAPMSGAAVAGRALNAPRRAKQRGVTSPNAAAPPTVPPGPSQVQPPPVDNRTVWQEIARIPGASPLVHQLAARAVGA